MKDRQSQDRIRPSGSDSIRPAVGLRNQHRQFFHHILRLADGADHARAGGEVPFLRHRFAGVAAPAFDVSALRENAAPDFHELVLVQPRFARAVDVIAVIEHKTRFVRMPEILEVGDLHLVAPGAGVEVIDDFATFVEPDEVDVELVAHGADQADQILMFLLGTIEITLFINQPCDLRVRPDLIAKLFGPQTRCTNKIRPPMIVRRGFVFFPLIHRRPAHQENVFAGDRLGRESGRGDEKSEEN